MSMIKARVIGCIYVFCELKIGQVYCLLDRDRRLLKMALAIACAFD